MAPIEHCGVDEAHKTLCLMTCPSKLHKAAITYMKEKVQGWIDQAMSTNLPRHNLWFLMARQFMQKVMYGIGVNSAPYAVLLECLTKQYYNLVPQGSVQWSANRMARQLNKSFTPSYSVPCFPSNKAFDALWLQNCGGPILASLCGAFHTRAQYGRATLSGGFILVWRLRDRVVD